jgi:hypothetical protein
MAKCDFCEERFENLSYLPGYNEHRSLCWLCYNRIRFYEEDPRIITANETKEEYKALGGFVEENNTNGTFMDRLKSVVKKEVAEEVIRREDSKLPNGSVIRLLYDSEGELNTESTLAKTEKKIVPRFEEKPVDKLWYTKVPTPVCSSCGTVFTSYSQVNCPNCKKKRNWI